MAEAIQAYRVATQLDPAYFRASFNLALCYAEAGNLEPALESWERALAASPDSTDARLNFAAALKQGKYFVDASNELEKVLASAPNETRAHFALGNLCAQQLHQPARARAHYLKVLEAEPGHPQASTIHYWLVANPG